MIRDRLYSQIAAKIREPLDTEAFERAAAALLEPSYPTLVPVSGGQDAGQDGVTAGPDPIILVSTTGEEIHRNLATSLKSHVDNGGISRRAIFATSRSLNRVARDGLAKVAKDAGFELVQAYGEDWFIGALYQNTFWRRELLDISGDAPALSSVPPSIWAIVQVPLVGRESDLEKLRAASRDGIVSGVPGVGKSAVLRQLAEEDWGLFLAADDPRAAANDIRELNPSRVIVDDAQFAPDRLVSLRRLREEMNAEFAIVAVTWPGYHQAEVAARLPGAWLHILEELTRDEIVEILRLIGLENASDDLLRVLVNQARGRPGLAVTLASLVINGNIREVANGDALFRQVTVTSNRLTGAESGNILGILALGGDTGVDLETVAAILQVSLDTTQRILNGLASGGMISEVYGRDRKLVVLPEDLRYPIVRQVFFGGATALDIRTILPRLPDPAAAVIPLIGASYRGASVPDDLLRSAVLASSDLRSWKAYAAMGEGHLRWAVETRPQDALDLAIASLDVAPEYSIRITLDTAATAHEVAAHAKSPLEDIEKWINSDDRNLVDKRLLLASVTKQWFEDGGSSEVSLTAYCKALDPDYERLTTDPGAGLRVTIRRGHLLVPSLRRLEPIWEYVLELLGARECHDFRSLIKAVSDWCFPGRMSGAEVDADVREFARRVISRVIVEIVARVPQRSLIAKLDDLCKMAGIDNVPLAVDEERSILFPQDPYGRRGDDSPRSYEAAMRETQEAAQTYADTLLTLSPEEAVGRLSRAAEEVGEVEDPDFQYAAAAATRLAEKCNDVQEYASIGLEQKMHPTLLFPFLRASARVAEVGSRVLERAKDVTDYSRLVSMIAILEEVPAPMFEWALENLDGGIIGAIWGHIYRGEVADTKLIRLLNHPNRTLAGQVAEGLYMAGNKRTPEVDSAWQNAVIEAPVRAHHSMMLQSRSDLLLSWVKKAIERRSPTFNGLEYVDHEMRGLISKLPIDERRALLESISKESERSFHDFVPGLVGEDLDLAKMVFETTGLVEYGDELLRGDPSDLAWQAKAVAAIENGWEPERVVRQVGYGYFDGPEDAHCQRLIDKFRDFAEGDTNLQILSREGVRYFTAQRDDVARSERRRAIDGR
jgi:hypothetical protein